jgi:hypothetical protein
MSVDAALAAACQEWRSLAETEGEAIRTLNWNLVAACQAALADLQTRLSRIHEAAKREWAQLGKKKSEREAALRNVASELIKLEKRNLALLNDARRSVQDQLDDLDQSRLNLKRIQRSYAVTRPAAWNSYS